MGISTEALAILLIIGAYLLGAIPFGLLIGYARGVDIRQHGSQNIGATNTGRVLGKKWGLLCLALDLLKGLAPTLIATRWLGAGPVDARALVLCLLVGVAAVVGHTFPIYLGFRGGKGVSTTIGVALGIYPIFTFAMVIAVLAFGTARYATGIVSVGSLALAISFPIAVAVQIWLSESTLQQLWPLQTVAIALGALILVRHRSNFARLLRGEEPVAGRRARNSPAEGT